MLGPTRLLLPSQAWFKNLPVFRLSRVSAPNSELKNRCDSYVRTSGVDNGVANAANDIGQVDFRIDGKLQLKPSSPTRRPTRLREKALSLRQSVTYQVIFTGAVLDEAGGSPIVTVPVLSADLPGLSLRAAENALFVGSAVAANVFPDHATKAYGFNVSISAFGYRSITLPVAVPIASTFALVIPPVILRRIPCASKGGWSKRVTVLQSRLQ